MVSYADMLRNIVERLGKPKEEISAELQELVREEEAKGQTGDVAKERAIRRLLLKYKRELMSPARWFEGIVIGDTGPVDVFASIRRTALDLFAKNPQQAINLGWVNAQGQPLDRRPTIAGRPNPNFGQPLPENAIIRVLYGAYTSENGWSPFRLMLGQRFPPDFDVPLYKPVKFRANIARVQDGQILALMGASVTRFEPTNIDNLNITKVIDDAYSKFKVPLSQIVAWHAQRKDLKIAQRLLLTEGDVVEFRETNISNIVVVTDEGVEQDVAVFVPKNIVIDFGRDSRVLILGRTAPARRFDAATGQRIETGGVNINALGVYAIPEYRYAPEEEEVIPQEGEIELWR